MRKIASFPFTFIDEDKFGKIFRPYATILVYSKLRKTWQPIEMVIDTGADYTIFPEKYVDLLGISLKNDCFQEKTSGIGGVENIHQCNNIKIKIGTVEKNIPCGFLNRNDIPPLLGRLGCLEIFKLIFEDKTSTFKA